MGLAFSVPDFKIIVLDELSKPGTDTPTNEKTTIEVAKDTEKIDWDRKIQSLMELKKPIETLEKGQLLSILNSKKYSIASKQTSGT